jgi:hypothetical protein
MLVRCVGCRFTRRKSFRLCLGGEKQGKSTFIRFLNPFELGIITEVQQPRQQKTRILVFQKNFIYNLEELASLRILK